MWYIIFVLLNWFSMYIMRYKVYDYCDGEKKTFPTYVYLLLGVLSIIPIVNIISLAIFIIVLIIYLSADEITIKGFEEDNWLTKKR
jgi:hypothetical protein